MVPDACTNGGVRAIAATRLRAGAWCGLFSAVSTYLFALMVFPFVYSDKRRVCSHPHFHQARADIAWCTNFQSLRVIFFNQGPGISATDNMAHSHILTLEGEGT
jgi:hypothetical protein